ncbi:glycosyl transferase family 2 [Winogradskyella sp. PC-19]|uniref:glycosyltransferase family 2 protein n=1 Tax=unclassified Winogradskyella TaxID=2615021 RepID=UPI000B3CCF12|nr:MULTISPECIES: glycosyltransferase family 2 protein [unclassified Winogradskyella]ARV10492.1 glycosyl transferase family 2 [Winogradskyella sp. PC-19]
MPQVSIIISTYNQPLWLEKVLVGYEQQSFKDFEIIIADDGSTEETNLLIKRVCQNSELNIKHIWQEDEGFRKTRILNKSISLSQADYLLFTDGDCIPRKDFIQKHIDLRRPNCFLSGGYFKLPKSISDVITQVDIVTQNCFDKVWLLGNGLKSTFKTNKLTANGFKERFLNKFTPTKATWDGMNASGWKRDIVAVNGFDERMAYGGEDRELGERLMNYGVKPLQIRYSAICVHLYHTRAYKNEVAEQKNLQIRKETKSQNKTWTDFGLIRA